MKDSTHVEDLEINFAAFVNAARSVTFILQKEFKTNVSFLGWYGNSDFYKNGEWNAEEKEPENTKIFQMTHDELCKYFVVLRNQIVKEGINGFICTTHVASFNSKNLIDRPPNSSLQITGSGIYYLIEEGTSREDKVPARVRKASITTRVSMSDAPSNHLGVEIPDDERDILSLSKKYYGYLKSLVEEWTGIVNEGELKTHRLK